MRELYSEEIMNKHDRRLDEYIERLRRGAYAALSGRAATAEEAVALAVEVEDNLDSLRDEKDEKYEAVWRQTLLTRRAEALKNAERDANGCARFKEALRMRDEFREKACEAAKTDRLAAVEYGKRARRAAEEADFWERWFMGERSTDWVGVDGDTAAE